MDPLLIPEPLKRLRLWTPSSPIDCGAGPPDFDAMTSLELNQWLARSRQAGAIAEAYEMFPEGVPKAVLRDLMRVYRILVTNILRNKRQGKAQPKDAEWAGLFAKVANHSRQHEKDLRELMPDWTMP